MTTIYQNVHPACSPESDRLVTSFLVALGLHVGIMLTLPYINRAPAPAPIRMEVELTQLQEQPRPPAPSPPPELPPPQQQPKPTPRPVTPTQAAPRPHEIALPVLTTKDTTPPTPQDTVVAQNPAPPAPASDVVPSAPVSAIPEQVATESGHVSSASSEHSSEADSSEAWEGYGQQLFDMVSRNKNYPQIAIRRHLEGKAKVSVHFIRGKLAELTLVEPGSGHKPLDDAAMEMLRKAVNALPIKGELSKKSFTVIVPVDFRIEG